MNKTNACNANVWMEISSAINDYVKRCKDPAKDFCGCPHCVDCNFNGYFLRNGHSRPGSGCKQCKCVMGNVVCEKTCPKLNCSHPAQASCCYTCDSCQLSGFIYQHGSTFANPLRNCEMCECNFGNIKCIKKPCPAVLCRHSVIPPGSCCPECMNCQYQGRVMISGEITHDRQNRCKTCKCLEGTITCSALQCTNYSCTHPGESECGCPTCESCSYEGVSYNNQQEFKLSHDPCLTCICVNGNVNCKQKTCSQCHSAKTSCKQCDYPSTDSCGCPSCDNGCLFDGQIFHNGSMIKERALCERCYCVNGNQKCQPTLCVTNAMSSCTHPVQKRCCPSCFNGCFYHGRDIKDGTTFPDPADIDCSHCFCQHGNVLCGLSNFCNKSMECFNGVKKSDHCGCQSCQLDCILDGLSYKDGSSFLNPADPCKTCRCQNGQVSCEANTCPNIDLSCLNPARNGCGCRMCENCEFEERTYKDESRFQHPSSKCQICQCQGILNIQLIGAPRTSVTNYSTYV